MAMEENSDQSNMKPTDVVLHNINKYPVSN